MKKIAVATFALSLMVSGAALGGVFSNGQTLLESRCAVCHPSSKAKVLKRTSAQWDAIVSNMMKKGAKLNAEEKKTLVKYLAENYKK
ncbi:hypothetical protein GMSM_24270 [Geomonas sp. Red276]